MGEVEDRDPKSILKADGVFTMENPANKEPDDDEVTKIINMIKGVECDTGFSIDEGMANSILRHFSPDKVGDVNVHDYTLVDFQSKSLLVARDKEGICLWAVNLPQEVPNAVEGTHFEEELSEMQEMTAEYKKVRVVGNIILAVGFMALCGICGLVLYFNHGWRF